MLTDGTNSSFRYSLSYFWCADNILDIQVKTIKNTRNDKKKMKKINPDRLLELDY